jgi:hypothetical protein
VDSCIYVTRTFKLHFEAPAPSLLSILVYFLKNTTAHFGGGGTATCTRCMPDHSRSGVALIPRRCEALRCEAGLPTGLTELQLHLELLQLRVL